MTSMMILPLSVVLLATLDYIHAAESLPRSQIADTCDRRLGDYISERCLNLKTQLVTFSGCSYTCQGKNAQGQNITTNHYLMNGLPCGDCKECCNGACTSVKFGFGNPLTFESCAKQKENS
uniref:Putative cysteine rich secreted peptide n=1 Tax=Ixodes scapularis TaxID=6945 RepID=Q4PN26_IXOSC|nr:putative cysteine rich secreted peptide [Ixodes scapularis]